MTYYRRLGVAPSASTEEIRAAYRELAQRLHPDRQSAGSRAEQALAERRMREINEAWRALGDPARRRSYDATLRGAPRTPAPVSRAGVRSPMPVEDSDDDLIDVMGEMGPLQAQVVRGLPWVLLLGVFAAIFVFTAYATAGNRPPRPVSPRTASTVAPGSCLQIRSGSTPPATTVVDCGGSHDVVLVSRVDERTQCPLGTERRRLSTDGFLDCVRPS